jgi:hypothetical protein
MFTKASTCSYPEQVITAHTVLHYNFNVDINIIHGERGSVVVEALGYKPEGRGIASR